MNAPARALFGFCFFLLILGLAANNAAGLTQAGAFQAELDSLRHEYGAGVAISRTDTYGPVYGHGGWVPGYTSSLRYYAKHGVTVALQINTDIDIVDGGSEVIGVMERRLAGVAIAFAEKSVIQIRQ